VPFVQCALDPQSAVSEHGHEMRFAKHRPPVQWSPTPQSLASRHSRAPVVPHSLADVSATSGGGACPQAATTTTITRTTGAAIGMRDIRIG
jgi:hypothetical protein